MQGRIQINIPPDSEKWLFSPAPREDARLWSLGRFPPKCKPGDDILFRFGGQIVAAATVHSIHQPGLFDGICHNGLRYLRGWKVVWTNRSFIDLRNALIDVAFACNDDSGNFAGHFEHVRLDDSAGESISLYGPRTTLACTPSVIRAGRRCFECRGHATWVGNWHWDAFSLPVMEATRLLTSLVEKGFECEHAQTHIFELIKQKRPFIWRWLLECQAVHA